MRLEVGLNLRLSQQLRLAPQIIQSIEILQLPAMDLKDLIENELLENEALEITEPAPDDLATLPQEERKETDEDDPFEEDAERVLDRLDALADAQRDAGGYSSRAAAEEASDRKLEAMQNTPALDGGLAEHLVVQLEEMDLGDDVRRTAEALVYNLDAGGYLPCSLQEVVDGMDDPTDLDTAERALRVVQTLDPAGVGARGLAECLLLQIEDDEENAKLKRVLIRDHLDDVTRNKLPKVAKALDLEVQDVYDLIKGLAHLSTRPGIAYAAEPVRYILPDVVVDWEDGDYLVSLVNDHLPRVGVSPRIRQMLRASRDDPKMRDYLKKKIDSAKWLIEAIAQRKSTLERVAKEIVRRQRDYLDFGVSHLKPLKMQEVADALGIHVSTVSRAISDKYAQTPQGIVPLKYFFTGGTESEDGGVESRQSVKERVRHIIEQEEKSKPYSDDEIADRLNSDFGLSIARRTVTKYRKALGIPSSRQRRVWS